VTFQEIDTKRTHLFTRASFVGEGAAINTATGEVTGISIASDSYQLT
jgi:cytochrome bd-type quinol oxidase subunit 1